MRTDYNKMPRAVHRDNKETYNESGWGSCGYAIRVPSLKRSKKTWENFYSFGQNYYDEIITDTVEYYITEEDIKEAPFEIEGGMVYSVGVIKVYDIIGRLVAMRPQSFNVNALPHSAIYLIVAEEGVIKYNGAYCRRTRQRF